MKNSIIISVARLALLISMSFLFIQCTSHKQFGFSDEIKQHFGDMTYREVIIPNNYGFNSRSSLKSTKGEGTVEGKNGRRVNYRYYMITDDQGEIGGFYLGTNQLNDTGPVRMTHDEANDRLNECKEMADEDYFLCVDALVDQIIAECDLTDSNDIEECTKHCWFNVEENCDQG